MVDFDAIQIGQAFVPVVLVFLHHPDFVLHPPLGLEWAGPGDVGQFAQIVVVLLQGLFAEDDVPAAGKGGHHEIDRPRCRQLKFDGVFVAGVDLADRREQCGARDADTGRRLADAVVGCLDVGGGKVRAVMELHALAQVKRIGLAVFRYLPTMREIGNNGLAAVARVAADQVVEHATLGADIADGAGLMHIEMRRAVQHAIAQHAAALGVRLRCRHLEFRSVVFVRDVGGEAVARGQTIGPHQCGGTPAQHVAARPAIMRRFVFTHGVDILPVDFFVRVLFRVFICTSSDVPAWPDHVRRRTLYQKARGVTHRDGFEARTKIVRSNTRLTIIWRA